MIMSEKASSVPRKPLKHHQKSQKSIAQGHFEKLHYSVIWHSVINKCNKPFLSAFSASLIGCLRFNHTLVFPQM